MAHFAELDPHNVVLRVLVVSNEDITDDDGNEQELLGVNLLHDLFENNTSWIQTSYNKKFRGSYAGPGMVYDQQGDMFVYPELPLE